MPNKQLLGIVFSVLFLCQCSDDKKGNGPVPLSNFGSCQEVAEYIEDYEDRINNATSGGLPMPLDSASAEGGAQAGGLSAGPDVLNNLQESGVDEPDHTRVGSHHIFTATPRGIEVVNRSTLQYMGRVPVATFDQYELLTYSERLIVIQGNYQNTTAITYDISAGKMPTELKREVFHGNYVNARLIDGHVLLVFNEYIYENVSTLEEADDIKGCDCRMIVRPEDDMFGRLFTRVASFSVKDLGASTKMIGLLGYGQTLYMSRNNLYTTHYRHAYWWLANDGEIDQEDLNKTHVTKIAFDSSNGDIRAIARGRVNGRVKDQWSFKEYGGEAQNLAIASTLSANWQTGTPSENALYIFKQKGEELVVQGQVEGLGIGETIRSTRFIDDMAYIVTFRTTDPLYAIKISNPEKPELLGELKIPGFSTYMHPTTNNRIIGVGFDAIEQGTFAWFTGVQVSLFDVSNPKEMVRLDNHVLGHRGSYSDATADHRAFYYDPTNLQFAIPAVELIKDNANADWQYGTKVKFSGAIVYKVEPKTLREVARMSHEELLPEACQKTLKYGVWWRNKVRSKDINRIYKVDGRMLTISQFGIKTHDALEPARELSVLQFPDASDKDCRYGWVGIEG